MDKKNTMDILDFEENLKAYGMNVVAKEKDGLTPEELTNEIKDPVTRSLLEERRLRAMTEGRRKAGRPKGDNSENEMRMTFVTDKVQLSKIREIAHKTGIFVKDILFEAFRMYLDKYEKENGEVNPQYHSK